MTQFPGIPAHRPGRRLTVFEWPKESTLAFPLAAKQVSGAKMQIGGEAVSLKPHAAADAAEFHLPAHAPTPPATAIAIDVSGDLNGKEKWTNPVRASKSDGKKDKRSARKGPAGKADLKRQ